MHAADSNVISAVASPIKAMEEVGKLSNAEMDELKIVYAGMENREALNAFRDLRTKLLRMSGGKNFVCLVTSAVPNGGSSFVSMNLSASIALDVAKTSVWMDCNLYEPAADKYLGLDVEMGITDFLSGSDVRIEDIVYATGVPRMRVVPVGTHSESGAEYFSSEKMKEFIASLKARYTDRFIIIDAPPITSSAESLILSSLCDMAVLVVPYGKVNQAVLESSINAISPDKLAGIVFNN